MGPRFLGERQKVLKLIVALVAQLCDYINSYGEVYSKILCYVIYYIEKLF